MKKELGLGTFVLRRLLLAIPQLAIITTLVFFLIRLLPANPVARLVGLDPSKSAILQAKKSLGLAASLPSQFATFVKGIFLHGSLGISWVSQSSVVSEIGQHAPITLQLMFLGFLFALIVAVPVGVISAIRPGGFLDRAIFSYGLFAGAAPDFWWGLTFIFLFVFKAHLFPVPVGLLSGGVPTPPTITGFNLVDALLSRNFADFATILDHYLLPSLTMAFVLSGPIIKMIRQNMLRFQQSEFVVYARASGLPGVTVARYILRNAISPVITLVGILFGFEIGGAVLIETVFSLNGLGQYAVQRTLDLDYPAIQGVVLVMTGFALLVYLAMDVLYAVIDPRIRY